MPGTGQIRVVWRGIVGGSEPLSRLSCISTYVLLVFALGCFARFAAAGEATSGWPPKISTAQPASQTKPVLINANGPLGVLATSASVSGDAKQTVFRLQLSKTYSASYRDTAPPCGVWER